MITFHLGIIVLMEPSLLGFYNDYLISACI